VKVLPEDESLEDESLHVRVREATNTDHRSSPLWHLAQPAARPLSDLIPLSEYREAGLDERHARDFFPKHHVDTVEDLVGLIRAVPSHLAQVLGTTSQQLVKLHNVAMANFMPSQAADITKVLDYEYALGAELGEPPARLAALSQVETVASPPSGPEAAAAVLPGQVWSLIDQHMPPVRNQGDRGTCVAFAAVAVLEYQSRRAEVNDDLSAQHLYWQAKNADGHPKDGTWLNFAFEPAHRDGVCREELWPYESDVRPGDLTHGAPPAACANDALDHKFSRIIRLANARDPQAIKDQLLQERPVAITIPVFSSWYDNPAVRLTGKIILPFDEAPFAQGGHAIVLVGFAEGEKEGDGFFLVRNSWGTIEWGRDCPFGAGYGTIPYDYIAEHTSAAWTGVVGPELAL